MGRITLPKTLESLLTSRRLKWIMMGTGAVSGLLVVGLLVLPRLIDINTYRGPITSQLEQRLGRSVRLGALSLGLLPSLNVGIEEAAVGENPQFAAGDFIAAGSVRLQLGWWSLLCGSPQVKSVELIRPKVTLIKEKSGQWNWATLKPIASAEPHAAGVTPFDLAVRDGLFTFIDRSVTPTAARTYTGIDMEVANFSPRRVFHFTFMVTMPGEKAGKLEVSGKAGPVGTPDATRTPVEAQIRMREVELQGLEALAGVQSPHSGRVTLEAALKGELAEELTAQGRFTIEQLRLVAAAEPSRMPLEAEFKWTAMAQSKTGTQESVDSLRLDQGEVRLGKTRAHITGRLDHLSVLNHHGQPPRAHLEIATNNARVEDLLTMAQWFGVGSDVTGTGVAALKVAWDASLGGTDLAPAVRGTGNLSHAQLRAAQLKKPLEVNKADLSFTGDGMRVENLQARLGQSEGSGWLQIKDFNRPVIHFDLKLNQLIVSEMPQLLAANAEMSPPSFSLIPRVMAKTVPPAAPPRNVHAEGQLAVGKIVMDNLVASDGQSKVTVQDQIVNFDPLSLGLYGGSYQGRVQIDQRRSDPEVTLSGRLSEIDVNQCLSAMTGQKSVLYGRASGTINAHGQGRDGDHFLQSLAGQGQLFINDGKITSFDLMRQIEMIGKLTGLSVKDAATTFRTLRANFRLDHGRLITDDLQIVMGDLETTGKGVMQLGGTATADYDLLVKLSPALSRRASGDRGGSGAGRPGKAVGPLAAVTGTSFLEQGSIVVPLRMTGPIRQPNFSLNVALLQKRATERFTRKPGEAIQGVLDLFRRKERSPKKE